MILFVKCVQNYVICVQNYSLMFQARESLKIYIYILTGGGGGWIFVQLDI